MSPKKKAIVEEEEDEHESDEDSAKELESLGKQLTQAGKSKDALVKLLKKASQLLEDLDQDIEGQHAAKGVVEAMAEDNILKHKDKDVIICSARCFGQILRIHAPDTPYSEEDLACMFQWFTVILHRLEHPSDPNFGICYSVLDSAAQTKCCLLMLDLELDSNGVSQIVLDFFTTALDSINEENYGRIKEPLIQVLSSLLSEADYVSQSWLDLVLAGLLPSKSAENPALEKLTTEMIQRSEHALQPTLQKFFINVIEGSVNSSDLRDEYHTLIYQVYRITPQTMLPVLPKLISELQLDLEPKRLAALNLLGRLLSSPGSDMDTSYPELFAEFCKRALDVKPDVRVAFLKLAPAILQNCSPPSKQKVLKQLRDRMMDHDEKVRSAAVAAICTTVTSYPQVMTVEEWGTLLEDVATRVRDTKALVRRETARELMAVYRDGCKRAEAAEPPDEGKGMHWIPGRICLLSFKNSDMVHHCLDVVFKNGLVPSSIEPAVAARRWQAMYMWCKPEERQAAMRMLKMQAVVRSFLPPFIEHRGALREAGEEADEGEERTPPPTDGDLGRFKKAVTSITSTFANKEKTRGHLLELGKWRDNHVFKKLAALVEPGLTREDAQKLTKEVVQRLGGKGALPDFARTLCLRLFPGLMPACHASAIMRLVMEEGTDEEGGQASLALLNDCAAANPYLFAGLATQVMELVERDEAEMTTLAARIVASAGRLMLKHDSDQLKELEPVLLRLCREGPPRAAKLAVRALYNIMAVEAAQKKMAELCEEMAESLDENDASLIPKLQTLSGIGRIAPGIFSEQASNIVSFLVHKLSVGDLEAAATREVMMAAPAWARHSKADVVKATAVKIIARAFVPDGPPSKLPPESLQALTALEAELAGELEVEAELVEGEEGPSPQEASCGFRRLAAASAMLRLARAHDSRLSMDNFFKLSLCMQDNMTSVRTAFSVKVMRLVSYFCGHIEGRRASKYAALLALSMEDPVELNRRMAFKHLQEYVGTRRAVLAKAQKPEPALSKCGDTLHEQPEFILPYLVQVLAHHPDLLSPEEAAEHPNLLQPFSRMLQLPLEVLIRQGSSHRHNAAGATPAEAACCSKVLKILRAIKTTQDATSEDATACIYMLCDLGMALAGLIFHERCGGSDSDVTHIGGGCCLPQSLFMARSRDAPAVWTEKDAHLPQGFKVKLETLFPDARSVLKESSVQNTKGHASGAGASLNKATARSARGRTPTSRASGRAQSSGATHGGEENGEGVPASLREGTSNRKRPPQKAASEDGSERQAKLARTKGSSRGTPVTTSGKTGGADAVRHSSSKRSKRVMSPSRQEPLPVEAPKGPATASPHGAQGLVTPPPAAAASREDSKEPSHGEETRAHPAVLPPDIAAPSEPSSHEREGEPPPASPPAQPGNPAEEHEEQTGEGVIPQEVLVASNLSREARSLLGDRENYQLLGSGGPRSGSGRKRSRPDFYKADGDECAAEEEEEEEDDDEFEHTHAKKAAKKPKSVSTGRRHTKKAGRGEGNSKRGAKRGRGRSRS